MAGRPRSRVNDPATVRREYATEERFLARRLASWAELHGPLVEDAAVGAVAEGAPTAVLDVGCGTGDLSERLGREVGVDLVALDPSARMVDLARARGLHAVEGDVQALPFADEAFDCVLANRVLYHVPDLDVGLAEVVRVLRPGGRLVAVTYGREHLSELWDLVGHVPMASEPFSAESGVAPLHRHFDAVERRDLAGSARFPSRSTVLAFLAAYGDFSEVDLGARLPDVPVPFTATYRHSVLVAAQPLRRRSARPG